MFQAKFFQRPNFAKTQYCLKSENVTPKFEVLELRFGITYI